MRHCFILLFSMTAQFAFANYDEVGPCVDFREEACYGERLFICKANGYSAIVEIQNYGQEYSDGSARKVIQYESKITVTKDGQKQVFRQTREWVDYSHVSAEDIRDYRAVGFPMKTEWIYPTTEYSSRVAGPRSKHLIFYHLGGSYNLAIRKNNSAAILFTGPYSKLQNRAVCKKARRP